MSEVLNHKGEEAYANIKKAQKKEEDHDDDELYYLESLCHYHSGDFKQAVKYAKKVKKNAIDYPKAHSILLESLAYLGEAEEFTTVLSEIKKEQIDYYSLIALVQKLTMNIPIKTDFSAHFDKIEHYIQGFKQQQIQSNPIKYNICFMKHFRLHQLI